MPSLQDFFYFGHWWIEEAWRPSPLTTMQALLQPYMTLGYLAPFDLNDQTNVQIIGNRDKNKYHLHANLGLRLQKSNGRPKWGFQPKATVVHKAYSVAYS